MLDVLGSPLCAFLPAKQSHNSIYACRAVLMRRQACTLFCGRCGRFELTRRSSGRVSPLTIPPFVQPSFLLSLCPSREGGWSGCLSMHRLNAVAKQILRVQRPRSVSTRLCIRRLRECARKRSRRPLLSLWQHGFAGVVKTQVLTSLLTRPLLPCRRAAACQGHLGVGRSLGVEDPPSDPA